MALVTVPVPGVAGSVYGIVTWALTWLAFAAVYVTVKVSVWPLVSTSGKVSLAGTVTVIAVEPSGMRRRRNGRLGSSSVGCHDGDLGSAHRRWGLPESMV